MSRRGQKREWRMVAAVGSNVELPRYLLARGEGYAMVRARGCFPIVVEELTWDRADVVAQRD